MSSSWNSPFLPAQPNPTPVTTSKRAALRPPIHNPYDKFTQPEFDAWIGDITGALRKALKMEPEEAEAPVVDEKRDALARADAEEERERDEGDRIPQADHEVVHHGDIVEDDDGSEAFEDSFAHITSRKAKGKARDPREGPGLGNINHPVELKSASEVEEEESGSEEEWQRELRGDDEEEGEQEYSYDEDAEDEDQGEEEDDEWQGFRTFGGQSSDHAIELLSDDDDEEEAEKTSVRVHVERVVSDAEEDEDESEDGEEDEEGSVEEVAQPATVEEDVNEPAPAAVFPDDEEEPLDEPVTPVEILDPWVGPKTYAEDFYSGGDLVAPVAAGLTPNNMTPADMSPIVEAAGDDQDNNPTADFMLPSPSPEIIDVDADEDEPENESLPRSSPPPADAEDEFDELYADIDENFASSPPTKHAAPAPPSSGLPPTNITDSDRIELAALEADHHAQRPLEQHSDWEWDASSTRSGRAHVVDDFPTEEAFGYGGNYDNVEDDEDADTGAFGALPLGTSDLDLPETWGVDADLDVDEEEPMPQLLYEVFESPDPSVRVKVYDDLVDIEETQSAGGQDVLLGEVESVADVTRAPSVALFDVVDLDEVAAAAFQQFAEAQGNEPEADSAFSPRASAIIELQDEDSFGELPMTPSPEDGLDEQTQQTEEFFSGFEGTTEPMPTLDTADVLATIEALGTANEESLSAKYKAWVSEELEGSSEADQEVQDVAETTPVQAEGRISETNEVQPPVDEPETLNIEEPGNSAEEDQEAYSVEEVEAELVLEDDADALADDGFNDVASVSAEELGDAIPAIVKYIVEDIMTEGRQTEEPEGPIVTITIDESFNAEESPDIIVFDFTDEPEPDEGLADIEPTLETLPMDDEDAAASHVPQKKVTIDTDLDDIIPAPISADPTVPDPTSRPHTPELGAEDELPQTSEDAESSLPMLSSIPSHVVEAAVRYDDVDDDDGSVGQTRSGLFTPIGTGVEDGTPAPSDASTKGKEAPATPAKEEASPSIISVDQEEVQEVPDEVIEPASREATPIPVVDEAATPQAGSGQFSPPKSGYMEPVPSPKPKEAHPAADAEVDIPTQPTLGPASDDENAEAETAPPQEPTEATPEAEQVVDDSQPPEPAPADVSSSKGPAPITRPFDELEGGDTDADAETDADGEADPDYVAGGDNSAFFAEPDAFKLMGSNSTVAPGPIKDDEPSPLATPSSQEETKEELTEDIETVTIDSLSEPPETNGPPEAPVQAEEPIMPEETAAPEEAVEPEKAVEPEQAVALEEPFEPREPEQPNGSKATPDTEEDAATVEAPDAEEQPSTSATTPVDSEPSQTQKSRKRKRKSPAPALPPRVTRSKASTTEAPRRTRSQAKMVTNGKGKQKAKPASKTAPESVKDDSTDIASSRAASVVVENKMLPTPSGSASRAPSIASTESVESLAPSATMEPPPPVDMRPLFHSHTHSFIHHHHHRPAAPPSALAPPITLSQPSAHSRTSSSAIEVQSTSASLQQTPRKLRAPSVSSPVTRSNCKFHKISLPREEGGPRVSFIVPGCSLGDGELMSSQEIVDHGFATFDDHGRMIPDIESLDFNSYLIGVLRQLVGVDLLREQEVFYLPNPGERVSKKPGNKPALDKGKRPRQSISVIDYAALHDPKSPRSPVASASQSRSHRRSVTPSVHSRVTGSYGDAASVTGSSARPQDASRPGTASIMSGNSDLSDVDDLAEEAPKAKRLKRSPLDEADNVSVSSASVSASVGPSQSQSKPTKLRRSTRRPLNPDAAAYKPGPDDAAEESAEEAAPKETKNKRRKSSAKSNKRRLTEDTVSASAPVAKRTRMRKSHSAADAQKS